MLCFGGWQCTDWKLKRLEKRTKIVGTLKFCIRGKVAVAAWVERLRNGQVSERIEGKIMIILVTIQDELNRLTQI